MGPMFEGVDFMFIIIWRCVFFVVIEMKVEYRVETLLNTMHYDM